MSGECVFYFKSISSKMSEYRVPISSGNSLILDAIIIIIIIIIISYITYHFLKIGLGCKIVQSFPYNYVL